MKRISIGIYVLFLSKFLFAGKYSEYESDPSILGGSTGSDDYILAIMFPFILIGSHVVAHFYKSDYYTPVKEVVIFIVISIGVMVYWSINN